jgi:hypothetical protein
MRNNRKQAKAVAYLRQICCFGQGSEIVIPEFLRALHHVIPSGRNWFSAVDEQFNFLYQIPDFFIPEMVALNAVAAFVIPNFFTQEDKKLYAAWHKKNPFLSIEAITFLVKNYFRTDMYNLVHKPLDQHHLVESKVVLQSRIVGLIGLTRPSASLPFTDWEIALCVQMTPYVAHALAAPEKTELTYTDSGQSGLLVMNVEGVILYQSDAARQLLALSQFQAIDFKDKKENPIHANLKQLCHRLNAIFKDQAAPPPSWSHTNGNGRFNFRAYWLKPYT